MATQDHEITIVMHTMGNIENIEQRIFWYRTSNSLQNICVVSWAM